LIVPFIKTHGARNDFLVSWRDRIPNEIGDFAAVARAICARYTGVGADGWILLSEGGPECDGSIELWNSDGSRSEISGNGTRCAAAVLVEAGKAGGSVRGTIRIGTGAGLKRLELLDRQEFVFSFEMNMGAARIEELQWDAGQGRDAVILNVGNPQCAVFVPAFDFDWRVLGEALERHPRFPNRTNVSFVHVVDRHTLDVRFFERGAGETMSSGTGCTGAVAAAHVRGLVDDPVRVLTPAGPLDLRWRGAEILLAGPAEITGRGEFYYREKQD
jgi:diaminopimelate epimerase